MKLIPILFEWVLTSAFLILAVLVLRALLGKRIGAGLRYALWAVVLVRLLVPVQLFTTPVTGTSMMRETGVEQFVAPPPVELEPAPVPSFDLPAPTELPDGVILNYQPAPSNVTVKAEPLPVLQILGWLWLTGSLAMAAAFVVSNAGFARRLRRVRVSLEDADCPLPVYVTEGLPSPCLFGLLRPEVYVTPETAGDPVMLRHVLAHEYTHFRHGDHVWNVLRSAALTVHWWNPLVWLAVALSRRDCELACDEGALKRLGDGERIAYGRTLLALITVKSRPGDLLRCATTMTGGRKSVFDRVTRIAHAPKRWLWAAAAAVIAAALACVWAFGSAEQLDSEKMPELTADLTFSIDESDPDMPVVRMDGTVDGMELPRGAFWYPEPVWREDGSSELSLLYPDFTDSITGHVDAWWTDGDRTSVTMTTQMSAMLSSLFNVGYWEFTVDLNRGAVTQMDGLSFRDGFPDSETRFYPASISEEEAVRVARIAAKLLTEAENYYNRTKGMPALNTDAPKGPERTFLDREFVCSGETLTLRNFSRVFTPDKVDFILARYAIVDLDRDGVSELILSVEGTDFTMGYLILHEIDGTLYGYGLGNREFDQVKTDGSFYANSGAADWGYYTLSFTKTGCEYADLMYCQSAGDGSSGEQCYLDGFPVSRREFDDAAAAQRAKDEPAWYARPDALPYDFDWNRVGRPMLGRVDRGDGSTDLLLTYRGKEKQFSGLWNEYQQPNPAFNILDLNGDGRDEILFILHMGGGTEESEERFYVFDAETLEQYDTSYVKDMVIGRIESTGDEKNFYLSAPGMGLVTIPKTGLYGEPDEAVSFGRICCYTFQDGKLLCTLACQANHFEFCGGSVSAEIKMTGSGFQCGGFAFVPDENRPDPAELYRQVLLGEKNLMFRELGTAGETQEGRFINISAVPSFFDDGPYSEIGEFAVVDMDGSRSQAVILHIVNVSGDLGGYLLLHQTGGRVYGLPFYGKRAFFGLKADGTYESSDPTGTSLAVNSLKIQGTRYLIDTLAFGATTAQPPDEFDYFLVNHREATREEFEAVVAEYDQKEDAVWWDFTRVNIKVLFPY